MFFNQKPKQTIHQDAVLSSGIIDLIPIGILITGMDGAIQYVNAYAQQILQASSERLYNTHLSKYVAQTGGMPWNDLYAIALRGGANAVRVAMVAATGADVICRIHTFRMDDDRALPEVLVWVVRDITQEQVSADEIEKQHVQMAKMNSELVRWNAELKRISELKSNFLSIASHELKTPLTTILGYSELIVDTMKNKFDPDTFRMVENINRASGRLHSVIDSILDITRIEQKKLRLHPEYMDLSEVARECIDEVQHFAENRNIRFDCSFSKDTPQFYGDRLRMQQVFANLISNALKYSPDDSSIVISIKPENAEHIHIMVKDSGIGIDKKEQEHIFEAFYEVAGLNRHSTDSLKFMGSGTGLGLSIAKGIVDRHGGRIWVESEGVRSDGVFSGSEFHVVVPVKATIDWDDDETRNVSNTVAGSGATEQVQGFFGNVDKKPVVLIIDSDRETVEITSMILENIFEVQIAENGEQGLTKAFQYLPSVILLSAFLPGIDGLRIAKILRSQEETKHVPIVFISSATNTDEVQMCYTAGADDCIVKPFNGREIVEKIWRLLMKKKESHADSV